MQVYTYAFGIHWPVGDIATWFGVLVTAIVGLIVARLSKRTNQLAQAANDSNTAISNLQASIAKRDEYRANVERELILIGLGWTIGVARLGYIELLKLALGEKFEHEVATDLKFRTNLRIMLDSCKFEIPDGVRDRLHNVGNPTAALILRSQPFASSMQTLLSAIDMDKPEDRPKIARVVRLSIEQQAAIIDELFTECAEISRRAGIHGGPPEQDGGVVR